MSIAISCASCDKQYQVKDELAGKKIRCPNCSEVFTVSGPSSSGSSVTSRGKSAATATKKKPSQNLRDEDAFEDDDDDFDDDDDDDDDFDELPRRRTAVRKPAEKPTKKKKKKRRSSGSGEVPWTLIIGGVIGFIAVCSLIMAIVLPPVAILMAAGLLFIGSILGIVGSIGTLIAAFQEDVICGLLYLFVPFYGVYYLISRWEDVQPFGKCVLAGVFVQFLGIGIIALAGSLAAAATGG